MTPNNHDKMTTRATGYGSLLSNGGIPEESKHQSFSDHSSEGYDMEQMRLIVSSLRQRHHQSPNDTPTEVAPFTPDAYYYKESRQQWRHIFFGVLGGLLLGLLLREGWHFSQNHHTTRLALNSQVPVEDQLFDYIVAGGGPSGILAAVQLAQKLPTSKVVLLESGSVSQSAVLESLNTGPNPQPAAHTSLNEYDIPLMWPGIASTQRRTKNFDLAPDPQTSTYWPIPLALLVRGLGGCGLHNAMIYVRSLPSCFARWNLTGWSFDQMLPVYKSLEQYQPLHDDNNNNNNKPPHRGSEGPIRTTPFGPGSNAMGDYFVQAAQASGLPLAGHVNVNQTGSYFNGVGPEARIGAGYYEFNIRNGVRHSVANALLGNLKQIPSNLLVLTHSTVTQVLWSGATSDTNKPKATGVTYVDTATGNQGKVLLNSNQHAEVLLATGAIMTPQILWNSGIGDGGSLVHLPGVGKNLQDHPVLGMAYQITSEMTQNAPQMYAIGDEMQDYKMAVQVLNDMEDQQQQQARQSNRSSSSLNKLSRRAVMEKLGPLGTPGFSAGAFLRSPWANGAAPDLQLTVFPRVIEPHQPKSKRQIDVDFMRARAMLITVALLEPEARYEVRPSDLNDQQASTEAFDFVAALQYPLPSIQLPTNQTDYLTDNDVRRLAWGMERVRRILRYPPMSNVTTTEIYPGESVVNEDGRTTSDTLTEYIRANHLANSHWVGTTKMGRDDDPMAVLDERLRVRGVQGLRVLDSGAIPIVPNGNTHSTVCAVASRGVQLILEGLASQ